jgi:hypothetical protein
MSYSNNSKEYPSFPGAEKETVEQVVSRQRATNKQKTMVKTTIIARDVPLRPLILFQCITVAEHG